MNQYIVWTELSRTCASLPVKNLVSVLMRFIKFISCKNIFGVKKVWPRKVESYLRVNA